jgi:hypothetical protein
MLDDMNLKGAEGLRGKDVISVDGDKLGSISRIYYDKVTEVPLWFAVDTGLLGGKNLIVPVAGMELEDDTVKSPYPTNVIKEQPEVDLDDALTSESETMLSDYFGLGASGEHSPEELT